MLFGRAFGLEFSGRGMFVSACCEIGERRRSTVFVSMVQMNLIKVDSLGEWDVGS